MGIDLSIKPSTPPETGTCVVVKGINRTGTVARLAVQHGSPRGRLRVGDRILKVLLASTLTEDIRQITV